MLATSPKKTSGAGKKREREPLVVVSAAATAVEGAPTKKRRKDKDGGKRRRDDIGGEQRWAWTALAESSSFALAPLFTPDSRYFFTTAVSFLQIFSTATGKLVSTISAHTDTITALVLNPHDSTQLFSASLDGSVKRWDTHHGALLETLRIDQPVTHIAAHALLFDELFVVTSHKARKSSDSSHVFRITTKSASQLPTPSSSSQPPKAHKSSRTIHVGKTRRATGLAISACGQFLVAVGGTKAYVSRIQGPLNGDFTSFVSPDAITCLAVHPSEPYFATGDERGVVRLWYCLNDQALPPSNTVLPVSADPSSSKPKTQPVDDLASPSHTAPTTTLHWHAHAVSALSFTPSGAQLLSGGEESVLVIWQLHSGQREYVPRVGAPIGGISVCNGPNGGMEYATALVDGGVVFIGGDTLRIGRAVRRVRLDPTPTRPLPLAIHPRTGHILIPAAHPSSLQILSRNSTALVGEVEVAPASRVSRRDETPIEPVRVGLVALSGGRKGKENVGGAEWMATVDSRGEGEVYLKFWKWDTSSLSGAATITSSNLCVLNTRIDRPHRDDKVTSLTFSPSSELLATTGQDGLVKLWAVRRDKSEEFWICTGSFTYRNHTPSKAFFSPDGSLLAVLHGPSVTLWDTQETSMRGALTCVEAKEPREVGFVGASGRYVVILGEQAVALWDLIRFSVIWHVPLDCPSSPHYPHIVAHPTNPTFALFQYHDAHSTQVSIFEVSAPTPIRTRTLGFKLAEPMWTDGAGEIGVLGIGDAGSGIGRWSLILAGDDVKQAAEEGAMARGISVDTAPFIPRTLFEDIFGRGVVVPTKPEKGKDKEAIGGKEDSGSGRKEKRKARKAERKASKISKSAKQKPKGTSSPQMDESDTEVETPESSEPGTVGDVEPEAVTYVGMKSTPFLGAGADGTIHSTKKINGVVGVHSASDEDEEEEVV